MPIFWSILCIMCINGLGIGVVHWIVCGFKELIVGQKSCLRGILSKVSKK